MGEATANARRLCEELMAERVDPPLNRPKYRAVILFGDGEGKPRTVSPPYSVARQSDC
jgi:hypothetical protein